METDIGQPIDYEPTMRDDAPPDQQRQRLDDTSTPIEDVQRDYQPALPSYDEMMYQQQMMYPPPPMYGTESTHQSQSHDFFASIDKITIVVLFAAFIVGFFLGSSRQPVILRYD